MALDPNKQSKAAAPFSLRGKQIQVIRKKKSEKELQSSSLSLAVVTRFQRPMFSKSIPHKIEASRFPPLKTETENQKSMTWQLK